jgi:hypothetical protein
MPQSAVDETTSPEAAGRADAEAFEARLRAAEAQERDARLAAPGDPESRRSTDYEPPLDVGRLKARMEELVAFRNAVQESLVWRAAQAIRRLVGRAW